MPELQSAKDLARRVSRNWSARTPTELDELREGPSGNPGAELALVHVSKAFGRIRAVDDVSLRVRPGEFVSIAGPSGSGKSTLLALIGSLDHPDAGTISIDGICVSALRNPIEYRRHVVGFMFQQDLLLPFVTALENVQAPLIATGLSRAERQDRAERLLAEVGVIDRADHLPSELSGGERQRVALARALANEPRLLLADEPTGALDSRATERVLDLLQATREHRGMTLLVVSHDPAVADRADRVVHVVDGRIVSDSGDGTER